MFLNTQARVNIPSLSSRTLQRDIASSGFVVGSSVQVHCNVDLCMIFLARDFVYTQPGTIFKNFI